MYQRAMQGVLEGRRKVSSRSGEEMRGCPVEQGKLELSPYLGNSGQVIPRREPRGGKGARNRGPLVAVLMSEP